MNRLFLDLKIDPLRRNSLVLVSEPVLDDNLNHVLARRKLGVDLQAGVVSEALWIALAGNVKQPWGADVNGLAVAEQPELRGQLR